jgi:hypothetical protein
MKVRGQEDRHAAFFHDGVHRRDALLHVDEMHALPFFSRQLTAP